MKLTITHLKAPWPSGAKVGDVIELPAVPTWAFGKCSPAADDADVTVGVAEVPADQAPDGAGIDEDEAKIAAALLEAETQAAQEKADIAAKPATKVKPAKA